MPTLELIRMPVCQVREDDFKDVREWQGMRYQLTYDMVRYLHLEMEIHNDRRTDLQGEFVGFSREESIPKRVLVLPLCRFEDGLASQAGEDTKDTRVDHHFHSSCFSKELNMPEHPILGTRPRSEMQQLSEQYHRCTKLLSRKQRLYQHPFLNALQSPLVAVNKLVNLV